jgi:hypothetical protein
MPLTPIVLPPQSERGKADYENPGRFLISAKGVLASILLVSAIAVVFVTAWTAHWYLGVTYLALVLALLFGPAIANRK